MCRHAAWAGLARRSAPQRSPPQAQHPRAPVSSSRVRLWSGVRWASARTAAAARHAQVCAPRRPRPGRHARRAAALRESPPYAVSWLADLPQVPRPAPPALQARRLQHSTRPRPRTLHMRTPHRLPRRAALVHGGGPHRPVAVQMLLSTMRSRRRGTTEGTPHAFSRLDRARKLDFQAGKRTEVWFFIVRRVAPRQPSHLTTNPFVPCTHLRPGRAVLVSKPSFHGQLQECKSSLAHTRRPRTRPRFANARPR